MNSDLGLATLKSTACYIGIRAQLGNPINMKLPRMKKASCRRSRRRDLGSLGFIFLFCFLFFSYFLLFSFLYVVLEQIIFSYFYFRCIFWIWMLSFELKLNADFHFFSNYYLERLKFRQISGIRLFQFQIVVILMIRRMLYRVIQ